MRKRVFSISILLFTTMFSLYSENYQSPEIISFKEINKQSDWMIIKNNSTRIDSINFIDPNEKSSEILIKYRLDKKTDKNIKDILYYVTRFSSLKGLEYYSISKKKRQILFKDIYCLNNSDDEIRIQDPSTNFLNNNSLFNIHLYQNDSSFGKSQWDVSIKQYSDQIELYFENSTTLKKGIIKIVKPKMMKMVFIIKKNEQFIELTAIISLKMKSIPILEKKIEGSLANRLNAISIKLLSLISNVNYELPIIEE